MGFDQVSLFLYPPRWKRYSVADSQMKHYSGEPVRIVSAVSNEDHEGPAVPFHILCRWLEARQFEIVNPDVKYGHFCSAPIESVFGQRCPEIAISTGTEDSEVTELYCRFRLTRNAPLHAERWEAFMQDICDAFHLRISVSDSESVGPEEFLKVLRRDESWRYFAHEFGWPDLTE